MTTTIIYKTLKLYAAIPQTRENIPAAWYEAHEWEDKEFTVSHRPLLADRSREDSFLATPADERKLFLKPSIQESTVKFQWHLN